MSSSDQLPLFVYGSLMSNEVLEAILKRVPKYTEGRTVASYRRYKIPNEVFPGMVPRSIEEGGSSIEGVLLSKTLTELERYLLDEFEDTQYKKEIIEIELDLEGKEMEEMVENFIEIDESEKGDEQLNSKKKRVVRAFCYIWIENEDYPLEEEWSYDNHLTPSLESYVENAREFADYTVTMLKNENHTSPEI